MMNGHRSQQILWQGRGIGREGGEIGWVQGVRLQKHYRSIMSSPRRPGGELQSIKQPQKVKVLILSESRASPKDFYLIAAFTNLIKIDLSYNKLTAFPPGFTFRPFGHLRTLFLHYNKFTAIKQLLPVTESPSLHYLTLFGNPLEETKARHFFVNQMPTLVLMDDKPVRLDERNPDFSLKDRPAPLLSFPLAAVPAPTEPQSKVYIQMLIRELAIARKAYLQANPVIRLQRWWRHWRRRCQRKWKSSNAKPPEDPLPPQSSFREYKQSLEEMMVEQEQERKAPSMPKEKILSLLWGNRSFWESLRGIVQEGRVLLSREYCQLRGIHFQEIEGLLVVRHPHAISGSRLAGKRRLPFLIDFHQQVIVRRHSKNPSKKEVAREISLKACEEYKINRSRFMHLQERLIKREEGYRHYVVPQLGLQELQGIVRKEYWRTMRALVGGSYCELPFLLESLLVRQRAAVSIQRLWRGYRVRRSVNAFLKMKEKESAVRIQRWVRRLPFIHRRKFLLEVAHYLKGQRNAEITLEVGQLEAIEAYATYKENHPHNFAIPFQDCTFSITPHNNRITFHAPRRPYPAYFGLSFAAEPREGARTGRSCVLEILFKGVREVSRVTDSRGVRFVQLVFDSVEEAVDRKFILALKTYRMSNHQFIRSRDTPNVPPQYSLNLVAEINQNRLVTMVYDSGQKEREKDGPLAQSSSGKLSLSRSQGSSEIAVVGGGLSLHLKYFMVKTDLSCTLFIREPNYRKEERHPMQLQMKQFYVPRRSSHRYAEEDTAQEITSKISRNILSLEDLQPVRPQGREPGGYLKVLSTDQSHTVLQAGEDHRRSLNRLQSYRKSDSYDRFEKQVYPLATEVRQSQGWEGVGVEEKRERIEEIKAAHKKNIASISLQKTQNLTNLRRSVRRESEDRIRMIDDARSLLEQERARQHDRVRDHFKSASSSFETQFLKKGMGSIRRGLRDFQKRRPQRPFPASPPHAHPLKTEIKELSLSFEPEVPVRQALKQSVQGYDAKELTLKSQASEAPIKEEPPQQREQEQARQAEVELEKRAIDLQRKKLRKKRLVHSVFPQEFYPIKNANQIGFQLPKIFKK